MTRHLARRLAAPLMAALSAATLTFAASPLRAETAAPTRFTVETRGAGPDLIFIPGLASGRSVWDLEAKALEGRYRLHLLQIDGFAGSPAGANASGPVIAPTVSALHAYIADHHLQGATVIGHSMGGLIGLLLAEQHPDDVRRLLIVDSLPFLPVTMAGPSATAAAVEPQARAVRDQMLAGTQAGYAAYEVQVMARLVKSDAARAPALAAAQASDHAVVAQALYDDLTTDARPGLASVKADVTVLYPWDASTGLPQAAVDQLYQSSFAAVPHIREARIDGAYHFLMLDQPEAFDREVGVFLGR